MLRTHYASEIRPEMDSKEVVVAGWVHEVRDLGKIKFILLRDMSGIVQIVGKSETTSEDALKKMNLVKESVVTVKGIVKKEKQARNGVEINPLEIKDLNPVSIKIPFEVTGKVPADIDVRLDYRYIDLRRLETQAIFKVRSEMLRAFRENMINLGFQEINPPCIVSAATEGGTDLFPVMYFENKVFLAQSPQLYKQLAVIGGIDKVFMATPIFRAEKHNTTTHLNEIISLDVEMGFADYNDAMNVLENLIKHIFSSVKNNCSDSLSLLKSEVNIPKKIKKFTYTEIVEVLNKKGEKIPWGADFSKEQEKKMEELLGEEIFFITEWPTKIRAFYSMPKEDDEKICYAYDLMYKGLEIASGAQRIHLLEVLNKQLKLHGLDPANFSFYADAFKMGAPPHAGFALGADRLTMQLCSRENIRECALFPRDRNRVRP